MKGAKTPAVGYEGYNGASGDLFPVLAAGNPSAPSGQRPGRRHSLLAALAKNVPPARFLDASRPLHRGALSAPSVKMGRGVPFNRRSRRAEKRAEGPLTQGSFSMFCVVARLSRAMTPASRRICHASALSTNLESKRAEGPR